jgi:hypothetical protein
MAKEKRELDALVQVWVDRRYLATIQKAIAKYELTPAKHVSELLRYAVEVFVDSAVEQGLVNFIDTTEEATQMLSRFNVELNPNKRGMKNLQVNLQRDSGGDTFEAPKDAQDLDEQITEAMKKMDAGL